MFSSVYVVVEHHTKKTDAVLHGVYINKEEALGKALKVQQGTHGYVAVLKKPVLGKQAG